MKILIQNVLGVFLILLIFSACSIKPKADYVYTFGDKPGLVHFRNLSKHFSVSRWDFGNGQISRETSPSVFFTKGIYSVRLTVDGKGSAAQQQGSIVREIGILNGPYLLANTNSGDFVATGLYAVKSNGKIKIDAVNRDKRLLTMYLPLDLVAGNTYTMGTTGPGSSISFVLYGSSNGQADQLEGLGLPGQAHGNYGKAIISIASVSDNEIKGNFSCGLYYNEYSSTYGNRTFLYDSLSNGEFYALFP